MMMLSSFVGRIQKGLSLFVLRRHIAQCKLVPEDVKDGHFAVIAMQGEEAKRFVVELHYLNDPAFLALLDRAREEYGFRQKGTLAVPCRPQELESILHHRSKSHSNYNKNNLPIILHNY